MPTFGDFETVDEPLRISEEAGRITTLWRARRDPPDGRAYLVKVQLSSQPGSEADPSDLLDDDPGLEFLQAVKLLKKAHPIAAGSLAEMIAFGTSPLGAWYATEYCARKSLKEFIALQGGIDVKALEHVLSSVVRGCLKMRQATGRSHGSLKPSNILLAGAPASLRKTPLRLTDPAPSAQVLRAKSGSMNSPAESDAHLARSTETSDLRAIGELIFQLVEGRLITSGFDYNYPVERSAAWDALGQDGERWRVLCNRLLDPGGGLELSLERLAGDFPCSRGRWPVHKLAVPAGIAAIFVTGLVLTQISRPKPGIAGKSPHQLATTSGRPAEAKSNSQPSVGARLPSAIAALEKPRPNGSGAPIAADSDSHRTESIVRPASELPKTIDKVQEPVQIVESPSVSIPQLTTVPAEPESVPPDDERAVATPSERPAVASGIASSAAKMPEFPIQSAPPPTPEKEPVLVAAAPVPEIKLPIPANPPARAYVPIPVSLTGYSKPITAQLEFHFSVAGFEVVSPEVARFHIAGTSSSAIEGQVVERATQAVLLSNRRYSGDTLRAQAQSFADDVVVSVTGKAGVSRSALPADEQLEHWESLLQAGRSNGSRPGKPGILTAALKSFCEEEVTGIEKAFASSGRLANAELKKRLAAVRSQIDRLGGAAPNPGLLRRLEPLIDPHSRLDINRSPAPIR